MCRFFDKNQISKCKRFLLPYFCQYSVYFPCVTAVFHAFRRQLKPGRYAPNPPFWGPVLFRQRKKSSPPHCLPPFRIEKRRNHLPEGTLSSRWSRRTIRDRNDPSAWSISLLTTATDIFVPTPAIPALPKARQHIPPAFRPCPTLDGRG